MTNFLSNADSDGISPPIVRVPMSFLRRRGDRLDEEPMDAAVGGQFGVERSRHNRTLSHQHRESLAAREHLNAAADLDNPRSADEDHFQRTPGELRWGGK